AGAISALTPIAAMVLAIFLLREYPTKKQAVISFVPVLGVLLMTAAGNSLGIAPWYGVLVAIGNCLFCALFRVVNRWCAKDFNFFQRTWATMVTSMVLYTVIALIALHGDVHRYLEPFHHSGFVGALLILAVFCSVTATLLANYGAGRLTVVRYSALGTTTTLVASLAGILLLQEPISLPMCVGIIMIIVGVWKVNTTGRNA
ncbi:MAG: DMT family transporter, partial [Eubacteriales bacterium]|nr:DMT family transporter [Eubacteriales bacterium]